MRVAASPGLCCLGVWIDSRASHEAALDHRLMKANKLFHVMKEQLLCRGCSVKSRLRLLVATVWACVMHGMGGLNLTIRATNKLETWSKRLARQVLGLPRKTHESWMEWARRSDTRLLAIWCQLRQPPLALVARMRAHTWAGHLARHPTSAAGRMMRFRDRSSMSGLTRRQRPARSVGGPVEGEWEGVIIRATGLAWHNAAQDRQNWRCHSMSAATAEFYKAVRKPLLLWSPPPVDCRGSIWRTLRGVPTEMAPKIDIRMIGDNRGVVDALNGVSRFSAVPSLYQHCGELAFCLRRSCLLSVRHVPRSENAFADALAGAGRQGATMHEWQERVAQTGPGMQSLVWHIAFDGSADPGGKGGAGVIAWAGREESACSVSNWLTCQSRPLPQATSATAEWEAAFVALRTVAWISAATHCRRCDRGGEGLAEIFGDLAAPDLTEDVAMCSQLFAGDARRASSACESVDGCVTRGGPPAGSRRPLQGDGSQAPGTASPGVVPRPGEDGLSRVMPVPASGQTLTAAPPGVVPRPREGGLSRVAADRSASQGTNTGRGGFRHCAMP